MPGRPGGLGFTPAGELLVVSMEQRAILLVRDGELATYANLASSIPNLANDLLVDDHGWAYVGNYGFDYEGGEDPAPTRLIRVDPDRSVHIEEPWMMFPNGMILIDEGRGLVTAEAFADRLTLCGVLADGSLAEHCTLAELPSGSGPDGIAADAFGRVYGVRVRQPRGCCYPARADRCRDRGAR